MWGDKGEYRRLSHRFILSEFRACGGLAMRLSVCKTRLLYYHITIGPVPNVEARTVIIIEGFLSALT